MNEDGQKMMRDDEKKFGEVSQRVKSGECRAREFHPDLLRRNKLLCSDDTRI